ncbi:MAG: hypothetical protein HOV79_04620 [Hamadaea sp.]|nr:hypothetical protein [Hamadaea sp.]
MDIQEFLRLSLRYLHLVGYALLLGGWAAQYFRGRYQVTWVMRIGIGAALTFGVLLAIPFPEGIDLNYVKLAVKLGIGVLIGAAIGVAYARDRAGKAVSKGHFLGIGLMTLTNAAVAVFWR